jgi:ribosomal-protein-serine acetyltransferase
MTVSTDRPSPTIRVSELVLERWRRDHVEALLVAVTTTLEHLRPWMSWAAHYDRGSASQFLAVCEDGWSRGERFEYAIRGPDDTVVGSARLARRIAPSGLEIGYWVHGAHTRQGSRLVPWRS